MNKFLFNICIASAVLAVFCGPVFSQSNTSAFKKPPQPGTLSDDDIAKLKSSFHDEKTGKSYSWKGGFGVVKLTGEKKERALKLKKIPFRITAALYENKQVRGKSVSTREKGSCSFYLKDEDDKIVLKKSQNLDKMCPS